MNVVDSSGWIEYFLNSPMAEFFAPATEDVVNLVVPSISLLEVHRFLSRNFVPADRDACVDIMCRAQVIDLTRARAIAASEVMQTHKLAMADAVMYSIAQEFKATFWTQDVDYQGLPGVQYKARA